MCNVDPKLWTCDFTGFVINVDKKQFHIHWKQVKHNLAAYPSKHHSTQRHILVRPTYVLITIHKRTKNLFKWPKLPTTLQWCVHIYLPLTIEKPSVYKSSMSSVSIKSVLKQRRHLHISILSFTKQTVHTQFLEPTTYFECKPLNLSKTNKYAVIQKLTF